MIIKTISRFKQIACTIFVALLLSSSWATLNITATTSLVADLVQNVGQEHVKVQSLMGAGVDPHVYKATASDILKLQKADTIFYNGLHLEGRMADLFHNLSNRNKPVYPVARNLSQSSLIAFNDDPSLADPHVWFDPILWGQCALYVGEILAQQDPQHAADYKANALAYQSELKDLSQWGRSRIETLHPDQRILITSHDAYNYFGKAFGIDVIGIQGISTVSEAGLADIVSMVDFIKKRNVKAIFVETSVSPAAITRVSEDSGAKIGGELFSDSLGAPGELLTTPAQNSYDVGTYSGMFQYNMDTIVEGLK